MLYRARSKFDTKSSLIYILFGGYIEFKLLLTRTRQTFHIRYFMFILTTPATNFIINPEGLLSVKIVRSAYLNRGKDGANVCFIEDTEVNDGGNQQLLSLEKCTRRICGIY